MRRFLLALLLALAGTVAVAGHADAAQTTLRPAPAARTGCS
jgi:hypothetical protein